MFYFYFFFFQLLSTMNRSMNLPSLQRIAMEFEKENDIMDQRQEMMDDAIDDSMELDDEDETEEIVNQVFDEIGIDLNQALGNAPKDIVTNNVGANGLLSNGGESNKLAQPIGAGGTSSSNSGGGGGGGNADDDLQARLDSLRR